MKTFGRTRKDSHRLKSKRVMFNIPFFVDAVSVVSFVMSERSTWIGPGCSKPDPRRDPPVGTL